MHLLQTAIQQNSNSSQLYLLQGQALVQNKQPADAEKSLEQAVQLDKQNVNAVVLLAQLQAARGAHDQAIATYQMRHRTLPNNAALQVALGSLYESTGNWKNAQAIYQQVLDSHPDNAAAANNLAYILLEHGGSVNMALNLAQTARRGMPNSPIHGRHLGWAYYHNGAYSVAPPCWKRLLTESSDNPAYRYHLGVTYQKLNDKERAAHAVRKSHRPGSEIHPSPRKHAAH